MTDTIDKLAMYLSGGLLLLGVVVTGLIETLAGQPYGAAPQTNEAGEVIASPAVDPNIRTALVVAALLVLLLYAIYKLATPIEEEAGTAATPSTSD
jgi:hypothetical protein